MKNQMKNVFILRKSNFHHSEPTNHPTFDLISFITFDHCFDFTMTTSFIVGAFIWKSIVDY